MLLVIANHLFAPTLYQIWNLSGLSIENDLHSNKVLYNETLLKVILLKVISLQILEKSYCLEGFTK